MSDLAAIRAREQAATPGPWSYKELKHYPYEVVVSPGGDHAFVVWLPDGRFIAHARTDIPWLLAEVERLTAENARLQGCIQSVLVHWDDGKLTATEALLEIRSLLEWAKADG